MMYQLLSLVLLIALAAPSSESQPALSPQQKAVMELRSRQIEAADKQYQAAVDVARRNRDQAVDTANKNAARTLITQAEHFTRSGKLAEAIDTYKLVCSFDPTNPAALKVLKAAGVEIETKPAPTGGGPTAGAGNTGGANAQSPKPEAVQYVWQRMVQCPAENAQWTTIAQLTAGQTVDFSVTGAWKLGDKAMGPACAPADGVTLQGRMSSQPDKTFVIAPQSTFTAPAAGLLQVSLSIPDALRRQAKGTLEIMASIRK